MITVRNQSTDVAAIARGTSAFGSRMFCMPCACYVVLHHKDRADTMFKASMVHAVRTYLAGCDVARGRSRLDGMCFDVAGTAILHGVAPG